ncbi:MAG: bifunctional folylpolyglutamate synthase/dihydrofolate synthase [Bacteroidales bacterium]
MDYKQTLDYLFSQLPMYQRIGKAAYKSDLGTTISLDKYFDHPHKLFPCIHIAGTNGKGSVAHMLASVLQNTGYKTGLYTSPHLLDFRERIRINGVPVNKEYVTKFVASHHKIFEQLEPSFFEMTVAMAFDYFAKEKVDIAVIETGMGGRLDSTNIITPEVSVITNIGFDHTEFLGSSLKEIAKEKAGIIKPGVPVVIGEVKDETKDVFIEKARSSGSDIFFAPDKYKCNYALQTYGGQQSFYITEKGKLKYGKLETDLLGWYQQKNVITVLQTLDVIENAGRYICMKNVYEGLRNVSKTTGLLGRWQIIGSNPLIVCDTAHNSEGITEVLKQIHSTPYRKLHMVTGFVNDKNTSHILKLFPADAHYYFTKASIPRALDPVKLKEEARTAGLEGEVFSSVIQALSAAKKAAAENDLIFVGGSTFIVADAIGN